MGGSPVLIAEAAEGHHFDLVQRLTFLEQFAYDQDKRVQHMVRTKASSLRTEMLRKLEGGEDDVRHASASGRKEFIQGVGSPDWHGVHLPRPGTSPKGPKTVNGIVSVGHRDDT